LIQNSRYFFYGYPAKYALVGLNDQHIWLVADNVQALQYIKQAFESKISTVVFDLTTFENYTPDLIDNSVCFNWQIFKNALSDASVLDALDNINSKIYTGEENQLVNVVTHDIQLLSADRCHQLQEQLMCIYQICREVKTTDSSIADGIKEIVSVNIELSQIESELYNLANQKMLESMRLSKHILTTLNRIYE
jgi:hypothetical protein